MIKTRKVISFLLIFSVFVSNIGFILKYDCCIENAVIVLNVFDDNECCKTNHIVKDDCCETMYVAEDDCCASEFDQNVKINLENHNCGKHCFTTSEYKKLDANLILFDVEKINHFFEEITCDLANEPIFENKQYLNKQNIIASPYHYFGKKFLISNHKIKIPFPITFTS